MRPFRLTCILLLIATLLASQPAPPAEAGAWQARVDPWVLEHTAAGPGEFIVFLTEQADLSAASQLPDKISKGRYVYEQLTRAAERTQGPLLQALGAAQAADPQVEFRPYWVANMIWVRGPAGLVQTLAGRTDVAHLYANPWVKLPEASGVIPAEVRHPDAAGTVMDWGLTKVGAPQVWALGYTGQGAVIGGQDTGYQWDHTALKGKYRGWNGSAADHNYNWHDAIHDDNPHTGAGNPCGFNSLVPCDDQGHGTHTMGSMVGDDGAGTQIGMAPGARWIGCRNMEQGWGTPATYAECYQWFIAPTDLSGQNPRPDLAPDVINNSWSCPTVEGCTDPNVLKTAVENLRAAGIVSAHSAGNSGSSCGSVSEPGGIYAASFTVGATDSNDVIASFSSRGPVSVDGSNRLKPEISAPGVDIYSSIPNNAYSTLSGTSMAAPHVAGLVALIISARPSLAGHPDQIESLIETSATPRTTSQACGGIPGSHIPNNTYGYGRINALNAVQALLSRSLQIKKLSALPYYRPAGGIHYNLTVTNTNLSLPTYNLVITDVLPAGTHLISATLPVNQAGSLIRWDFASLGAGQAISVDLAVGVDPGITTTISNLAYGARGDQAAFVSGPPVTVQPAGPLVLQVSKSALRPFYLPGGPITYTLQVTNTNAFLTAHSLALSDTLPANTSLIGGYPAFTHTGDVLRWDFPALGPGGTLSAILAVQASPAATAPITNTGYLVTSAEGASASGPPVILPPGQALFLPLVVSK